MAINYGANIGNINPVQDLYNQPATNILGNMYKQFGYGDIGKTGTIGTPVPNPQATITPATNVYSAPRSTKRYRDVGTGKAPQENDLLSVIQQIVDREGQGSEMSDEQLLSILELLQKNPDLFA
tara:strand:+ start:96 stop:467 length:372 start_codon:yes stop_codon:yes gene_type:complete